MNENLLLQASGIFGLILLLLVLIALLYIQIKFIILHKKIDDMLSVKSWFVKWMYLSLFPFVGLIFFIGGIYQLRNNLASEFKNFNIPSLPLSNRSSMFLIISTILTTISSLFVDDKLEANTFIVFLTIVAFVTSIVSLIYFFIYWTSLFDDQLTLSDAKYKTQK